MSGSLAFGTKIRELREAHRMTLRALAEKLGLSAPFLSDIEHGRRMPDSLDAFAVIFDIDVEELRALDPRQQRERAVDHGERIAILERRVDALVNRVAFLENGRRLR